jgi:hypothetical protein
MAERGAWEVLDFDSQIIAVHAALLHTDEVLFCERGGAPVPHARVAVPHAEVSGSRALRSTCSAAATRFLPDGRLIAAGGTRQYDPFRGIRDGHAPLGAAEGEAPSALEPVADHAGRRAAAGHGRRGTVSPQIFRPRTRLGSLPPYSAGFAPIT